MGLISTLLSFVRGEEDGAHVSDVKIDPGGGDNVTARHYGPSGDDSHPLPDDLVLTVPAGGSGGEAVAGYLDPTEPQAGPGEKRIYARDGDGAVIGVLWLRSDGTVEAGLDPDDWAALASEVDARFDAIHEALDALASATAVAQDGGAALQTALIGAWGPGTPPTPASDVGSTTVKVKS